MAPPAPLPEGAQRSVGPAGHAEQRATPGLVRPPRLLWRALAWAAALALLASVFAFYQQPELRATLADQVWACFN